MNAPIQNKGHPIRFCECELDIKTVSEINKHEHWRIADKRHEAQQMIVKTCPMFNGPLIPLPCIVKFSRISPRLLDDDNLPTAFKWIRDVVAFKIIRPHEPDKPLKPIGRYDDDPCIKWEYAQEKGKPQRIKIEIFSNLI